MAASLEKCDSSSEAENCISDMQIQITELQYVLLFVALLLQEFV